MKTVDETMYNLKCRFGGICLVCGSKDNYNVCIICDAKVTARKSYKRYYSNCIGVEKTNAPAYIKERDKEVYKREAINYFQDGLEGLYEDERDKFHRFFKYEFDKLNNYDYMCKVLHFDLIKGKFIDNPGKWFDELKEFNRRTVNKCEVS